MRQFNYFYTVNTLLHFKINTTKAITLLTSDTISKRIMQIDLDELSHNHEWLEDLVDIMTIDLKKYKQAISWIVSKKQLTIDINYLLMYHLIIKRSALKRIISYSQTFL